MDREEGEMSDDNFMLVDDDNKELSKQSSDENCTVLYKADKNSGILVEKLGKVDANKLEERAKRFGLNLNVSRLVTQKQIDDLYSKSGIESGNERHFRFDALHLNGIDGLTTREIFEYLEDYKPVSMEKVDDTSCNIVCQDHIATALALLVHSREIRNEEIRTMLAEKSSHHWREGMPHPKKDLILMRFATNGDKKLVKKCDKTAADSYYDESMDPISKNPWGDLCKSWGVYDHQEVFQRKLPKNDYEDEIEEPKDFIKTKNKQLAMRLGKRNQHVEESDDDSSSDTEWKRKPKTPRMRMHADDEESKQKKNKQSSEKVSKEKEVYAPLSIEVMNTRSNYTPKGATKLSDKFKSNFKSGKKDNIQSRLGIKQESEDEMLASEEELSDNSEHNVMSRVQKVNNSTKGTSSVWDRLESKTKKNDTHSDLRQILKSKKLATSSDLRDRICKSKKSILRIEIDNN